MRANKYNRTGLRDRNGIEIKAGNIVQTKRVGIEYQTHYGNNIPNGAYTEPCGVIVYVDQYEVVFELGCFFLKQCNTDNHVPMPLFYLYNPDGSICEYTEEVILIDIDYKRNRDLFDNDYSYEKECLEALLEELGMTIDELIQDLKIEIIYDSYRQILRS